MDFDRLEDIEDTGPDWSVSRLHTIMACGKKYHYKYVEHIEEPVTPPLAFGSAIHKTIEEIHRNNLDDFQRQWSDNWYEAQVNVDWEHTSYRKKTYDDKGPKILEAYTTKYRHDHWLTLEKQFRFAPGHTLPILRGTFDKVQRILEEHPTAPREYIGRMAIIDYKTSKNPPEQLMVDVDPQLTIYHRAAQELYKEDVVLGLHHLPTDKIYWTTRNKYAMNEVAIMLLEGKSRVDNKKFERNIDWGCRYCPFKDKCFGELLSEPTD